MDTIRAIEKLNDRELALTGGVGKSWHDEFKDSAYIFIGGLDYALTEGDVLAVFSQYGEPVDIKLVRDKDTGKSKGFCFLAYEDQRSTVLAVDNFNGSTLCKRTIRVDHVKDYNVGDKDDDKERDREAAKHLAAAAARAALDGFQGSDSDGDDGYAPVSDDDDGMGPELTGSKKPKKKKKKKDKKKKKQKDAADPAVQEGERKRVASPQAAAEDTSIRVKQEREAEPEAEPGPGPRDTRREQERGPRDGGRDGGKDRDGGRDGGRDRDRGRPRRRSRSPLARDRRRHHDSSSRRRDSRSPARRSSHRRSRSRSRSPTRDRYRRSRRSRSRSRSPRRHR